MEVLKLTTKISPDGHLNISIPNQLAGTEVNVVVVVNPVSPSDDALPEYDFSDLAGRLGWQGNAVSMQRTLRNEW